MPVRPADGLPVLSSSTRDIIATLLRYGPLPRVELARRLSLSPASLTKLTRPMLQIGLFQQMSPVGQRTTGRPSIPLSVDPNWASFIGVKLTEDTAFGCLTDLTGAVLAHVERPFSTTEVSSVITHIVAVVNELQTGRAPACVGVTLAGSVIRRQGTVLSSPFLGWTEVTFRELLEESLRVPVAIENDLRALTAALQWSDTAGSSFALVTFGAGIGCGLVVEGRLVEGAGGAAGLIDHLRIRDNGPACARGHRGCASSYATTAAILDAVAGSSSRPAADLDEVADRARDGDPVAAQALDDAGYAVGVLIGTVSNVAGPATVLLSGEGVEVMDTLRDALDRGIAAVIHPSLPTINLQVTPLQFTDWARGAAVVAITHYLDLHSAAA